MSESEEENREGGESPPSLPSGEGDNSEDVPWYEAAARDARLRQRAENDRAAQRMIENSERVAAARREYTSYASDTLESAAIRDAINNARSRAAAAAEANQLMTTNEEGEVVPVPHSRNYPYIERDRQATEIDAQASEESHRRMTGSSPRPSYWDGSRGQAGSPGTTDSNILRDWYSVDEGGDNLIQYREDKEWYVKHTRVGRENGVFNSMADGLGFKCGYHHGEFYNGRIIAMSSFLFNTELLFMDVSDKSGERMLRDSVKRAFDWVHEIERAEDYFAGMNKWVKKGGTWRGETDEYGPDYFEARGVRNQMLSLLAGSENSPRMKDYLFHLRRLQRGLRAGFFRKMDNFMNGIKSKNLSVDPWMPFGNHAENESYMKKQDYKIRVLRDLSMAMACFFHKEYIEHRKASAVTGDPGFCNRIERISYVMANTGKRTTAARDIILRLYDRVFQLYLPLIKGEKGVEIPSSRIIRQCSDDFVSLLKMGMDASGMDRRGADFLGRKMRVGVAYRHFRIDVGRDDRVENRYSHIYRTKCPNLVGHQRDDMNDFRRDLFKRTARRYDISPNSYAKLLPHFLKSGLFVLSDEITLGRPQKNPYYEGDSMKIKTMRTKIFVPGSLVSHHIYDDCERFRLSGLYKNFNDFCSISTVPDIFMIETHFDWNRHGNVFADNSMFHCKLSSHGTGRYVPYDADPEYLDQMGTGSMPHNYTRPVSYPCLSSDGRFCLGDFEDRVIDADALSKILQGKRQYAPNDVYQFGGYSYGLLKGIHPDNRAYYRDGRKALSIQSRRSGDICYGHNDDFAPIVFRVDYEGITIKED